MSDPAVEATERAWEGYPVPSGDVDRYLREVPLTAARETSKPIRELHQELSGDMPEPSTEAMAARAEGMRYVLDELAKLIYTTEELES
ncbi:hypothetical protein H7J71_02135 [Mycolicibacterium peregrinum]|uniref:hypothetical protein n=1 Tax=Mycolicibacterium peregrinum TaxID=43304 RepID=UPI0006D82502|nr:hypothetical protein [Mycolicibacterium peregrinum]MCV7200810.1 hypothetical protein [Mycolicibacterium peregrinum]ORW49758.1 hypothetical protein AWC21_01650 [Mycolicibacterium peregrinum]